MSESLFWQDDFPKERRVELVANLLYSGDPNARIPNDEGLRPDRVEDFYTAVGFKSLGDFKDRMDGVQMKYRYGEPVRQESALVVDAPTVPRSLPSADPFSAFFQEETSATPVETGVTPPPEAKIPRSRARKLRVEVPEQPIVPVPSLRIESVSEVPIVETAPVIPTPDAQPSVSRSSKSEVGSVQEVHPEDRVSAFARGVLAWFGRKPQAAHHAEGIVESTEGGARTREVVSELLAKEFGAEVFEAGVNRDPKSQAHVEAANRLERAIATSPHLEPKLRASMKEQVAGLRAAYEGRMKETARARSGELQAGLDAMAAREEGDAGTALRVLAARTGRIADDVMQFREQVEHAAVQRDGVESVAAIDAAFQDAWRGAWRGAVTPIDLGPLEESLPRLRLLEGSPKSGVAQMVVAARASVQDEIDRRLPMLERGMKRAA